MPIAHASPCRCSKGDYRYFSHGHCLACQGTGIKNANREKLLKHNAEAKRPSMADYLAFDGAHCRNLYKGLAEDWQCPGCRRTKYQILRWTTLFPKIPSARRPGWAGGYHTHHDHACDRYGFGRTPVGYTPRFPPTVVCEQCNSADASAKRQLKLPEYFSFSPEEIRQFVLPYPHGKHLLDYRIARQIHASLQESSTPLFWPD
ncbi:TPA: hypothetical protein L4R07_006261 [Pseudomonas aeruginosa]|nr:hypothetical protein [Pseudomonas aeruginosa]HBO3041058.1 hypothetical protein [Pseudomonas aeruginosa]